MHACCSSAASCRSSVCDARGHCWEVCGLYVADASLFPTASGVSPMIIGYALPYMVASGLAQHWRTEQQRIGYRQQGGRPVACSQTALCPSAAATGGCRCAVLWVAELL
eukprot:GHRR01005271.1.p2 GENE.GHRR01005271.1~~GHRR01005271.1.p2  ORF type:complete len:109 (-),score=22.91 GHRR01005271.1:230-556(-)